MRIATGEAAPASADNDAVAEEEVAVTAGECPSVRCAEGCPEGQPDGVLTGCKLG